MKIVFLNGPPHCGKDTAAEMLAPQISGHMLKFAAPLKRACAGLLGETVEWVEKNKDRPDVRLNGKTPRSFLIHLSEDIVKPQYGDQFFGKVMVGELDKLGSAFVFITDSGFLSEAIPVVKGFGSQNCLRIEIHRPGTNFFNDSRSYWHMPEIRSVRLDNDGNLDQLPEKLFGIISNVWGCTR